MFLGAATSATAARSVSFSWTANTDNPPIDSYKLYYKTGGEGANLSDYNGTDASGGNKSPVVISGQATNSYTLVNLLDSERYTFVLTASRGADESVPTSPSVTLEPISVNSPPVASAQSFSINEGWTYNGLLSATDTDGDTLTYSIVSNGSNGWASISNSTTGAFTYTPSPNKTGSDTFTFRVNDGTVDSNIATVSVTILAVNNPPTANGVSITTNEDTVKSGQLTGSDPDGDALTFSRVTNCSKGNAVISSSGAYTYTPNANATGTDSFTFRVNDGTVNSATATVSVTISAVNDPPTANGVSITTNEDTAKSGQLTGNDPDGNTLTFSRVTNGSKGNAVIASSGTYTYTPNANATGTDSFSFRVNDGTVNSAAATVSVTIIVANDPPTANGVSITTNEDTAKSGQLTGSDPDGDALTFSRVANGSKGNAVIASSGAYTYTPNANATGTDSFTFRVNDGAANSAAATVSVTITAVNDPPTANGVSITTNEDTAKSGQLTGNDPDGNALTFSRVTNGSKGNAVIASSGSYTYTPNANATGTDSFTFRVNDGTVNSAAATVSVMITAVSDVPTANGASITTNEDTAKSGQLTGSDPDGNTLTFSRVTNGSKGNVVIASSGSYTYTPNANASGTDSFTFRVHNGTDNSAAATVNVTINAVNDPPAATNSSITTNGTTVYNGLLSGIDPDGDILVYSIVANGKEGDVVITDPAAGSYQYTPNIGASGSDSFTFKVNDGTLDSNIATINVTFSENATLTKVFGDTPAADYPGTLEDTFTNINPDINSNQEILNTHSWSYPSPHKVANTIIVKADLQAIPTYATIVEAELILYQTDSDGQTQYSNSVHKIVGRDPVVNQVNGYNAFNGEPWSQLPPDTTYNGVPLGLADIADMEDAVLLDDKDGYRSWLITKMVQEWITDPSANFGLLIKGEETSVETGRTFAATENQTADFRPQLVIRYSVKPAAPRLKLIEEIK